jgi:hypothetical protein
MNSVEKELHGYINGTERMSGFDSYDSYEGDMSYFDDSSSFDGDDFSYANGGSNTMNVSAIPSIPNHNLFPAVTPGDHEYVQCLLMVQH